MPPKPLFENDGPAVPVFVGITGAPGSGKDTLANLMAELDPSVYVADAAGPLRRMMSELTGIPYEVLKTQEGKRSLVELNGRMYEAREVMGKLGVHLEETYGMGVMAWMAIGSVPPGYDIYVFPGARRDASVYRKRGMVVNLSRPGCGTTYGFDAAEEAPEDMRVYNNRDIDHLREAAVGIIHRAQEIWEEKNGVGGDNPAVS